MNIRSEWRHRTTASDILGELDMLELRWLDELDADEYADGTLPTVRVLEPA